MEKIKFTVQILVLVLAFPVWFLAEMNMAGKAVKNMQLHNSDSTSVNKAAYVNTEKNTESFDLRKANVSKLMVNCN